MAPCRGPCGHGHHWPGCWWEREVVAQQRTLLLAAGWQLMILISYLLVQKVIRLLRWSTRPYHFCTVIDQLKHRNRRLSWNVAISNCASCFVASILKHRLIKMKESHSSAPVILFQQLLCVSARRCRCLCLENTGTMTHCMYLHLSWPVKTRTTRWCKILKWCVHLRPWHLLTTSGKSLFFSFWILLKSLLCF